MTEVLAHSYAATGEPSSTWKIGYANTYGEAQNRARQHYEGQLDGKPPTSWEPSYSWMGIPIDFYEEYKEKYKDWKLEPSPFQGEWFTETDMPEAYRAPYSLPVEESEEQDNFTLAIELDYDEDKHHTYELIQELLAHVLIGNAVTTQDTLTRIRAAADSICDAVGVEHFTNIYYSDRMSSLILETPSLTVEKPAIVRIPDDV